jgi:prolyl 4-hydroxylase
MVLDTDIEYLTIQSKSGDSASQARLGIELFQAGRLDESVSWLEKAASAEQMLAQNLLGVMYLNGMAVKVDLVRGAELLTRAASQGLREAAYTLSGVYANGFGVTADQGTAWHYLIQASRRGHAPALRVTGLLYCLNASKSSMGIRLLRLAAGRGDVLAQSALALFQSSMGSNEDKAEAAYWATQAAAHDMHSAKHLLHTLPLPGPRPTAPTEPDWERLESALPEVNTPGLIHTLVPDVVYEIDGALPQLVCAYLIDLSAHRLRPSMVVDPKTGMQMLNPVRTSHSMYFPPSMYDCVVAYARRVMAEIAQMPIGNAEPLSILRYTYGQEYKPHQDYFVGSAADTVRMEQQGGQRAVTVFAYLNDVEAGGETEFPELNLCVRAGCGKAVKFMNLDNSGCPDPKTLHAGRPVTRGEKWLATFWFRQRQFSWSV